MITNSLHIVNRVMLVAAIACIMMNCGKSSTGNGTPPPVNPGGNPGTGNPPAVEKRMLLADQSKNRVAIADVTSNTIVWEWLPAASNVRSEDVKWFGNMSDAKPVYNNNYILATASAGGVALVRVADKKTVFYAYAGNGNIHAAEVLPDGNIVAAASTGGYLILFHTDTTAYPYNGYTKKVSLPDAHNVVWDQKRQLLWSATKNKLYAYTYNFNCAAPDLALSDSITLPASGCHDLFPVYGKDSLWLSTSSKVWAVDLKTKAVTQQSAFARIKSVSSGPAGDYPAILLQSIDTDQQWYNDRIIDFNGNNMFQQAGLKVYKARWQVANTFSYVSKNTVTICP